MEDRLEGRQSMWEWPRPSLGCSVHAYMHSCILLLAAGGVWVWVWVWVWICRHWAGRGAMDWVTVCSFAEGKRRIKTRSQVNGSLAELFSSAPSTVAIQSLETAAAHSFSLVESLHTYLAVACQLPVVQPPTSAWRSLCPSPPTPSLAPQPHPHTLVPLSCLTLAV